MIDNANVSDLGFIDPGVTKQKSDYVVNVKKEFNEENYLNTRITDGSRTKELRIRVILTKDIDGRDKVDIPVEVHSIMLNDKQQKAQIISKSKFKSFICLNDPHLETHDERGCPLCNKKKQLFNEANVIGETNKDAKKALCKQAYKYESKTAYIVRCIERGKENEGVKFWRFNKRDDGAGILDELISLANLYRDNGVNIFDYNTGHDLILRLSKNPDPTPGAPDKTAISIMVDIKPSKLANTQEQIDAWVNDEKDWRDMYRSKSYDYLNIVADGESPVWSKEENKYVQWVDSEELKKRTQEIEMTAVQELKNLDINDNNISPDLPF